MAGSILSALYELNLTAMFCVLYLSLKFLGYSINPQFVVGRQIRG